VSPSVAPAGAQQITADSCSGPRSHSVAPAPRVGALSADHSGLRPPFVRSVRIRASLVDFYGAHRIVLDHICPAGKRQES